MYNWQFQGQTSPSGALFARKTRKLSPLQSRHMRGGKKEARGDRTSRAEDADALTPVRNDCPAALRIARTAVQRCCVLFPLIFAGFHVPRREKQDQEKLGCSGSPVAGGDDLPGGGSIHTVVLPVVIYPHVKEFFSKRRRKKPSKTKKAAKNGIFGGLNCTALCNTGYPGPFCQVPPFQSNLKRASQWNFQKFLIPNS